MVSKGAFNLIAHRGIMCTFAYMAFLNNLLKNVYDNEKALQILISDLQGLFFYSFKFYPIAFMALYALESASPLPVKSVFALRRSVSSEVGAAATAAIYLSAFAQPR